MVLIAPKWPGRPWYADLLAMLGAQPRRLPDMDNLLYNPVTHERQDNKNEYHAWLLTSDEDHRQHFLASLPYLERSDNRIGFIGDVTLHGVPL